VQWNLGSWERESVNERGGIITSRSPNWSSSFLTSSTVELTETMLLRRGHGIAQIIHLKDSLPGRAYGPDFFYYVGRMHGPYARGREFSRSRSDRSPPLPATSGSGAGTGRGRGAAGAGHGGGTAAAASAVCQCGARFCEAAERRVSLSLTSRRRRCLPVATARAPGHVPVPLPPPPPRRRLQPRSATSTTSTRAFCRARSPREFIPPSRLHT